MPSFEEHCKRCKDLMGEEFPEVHKWLDDFFQKPPHGTRHRYLRHHQEGIETVRKLWGDKAARAAELHINQDLSEEGWPEDNPIPADEEAYKKTGLW